MSKVKMILKKVYSAISGKVLVSVASFILATVALAPCYFPTWFYEPEMPKSMLDD